MTKVKIIWLIIFTLVISSLFSMCFNRQGEGVARKKTFDKHLGKYVLDLTRTRLDTYAKDSTLYRALEIKFKADSTFELSFETPFIYQRTGKWLAGSGDPGEWNWLIYDKWLNKIKLETGKGNQFTPTYFDNGDVVFYLNGATPKENEEFIQRIYFKKVSR